MPKLYIKGGRRLNGEVTISGAKNSVLPLLAATVLCDGESVLHNCPDIYDVETSIAILRHLGLMVTFENGTIRVRGRTPVNTEIPERMMRLMRSSVIFTGSLLARRKKATVSVPGGCELGPRPIDIHIKSLELLGARFSKDHGKLKFSAPDGLNGSEINMPIKSVGATENIMLASVLGRGKTVINNAACEPEIVDLADFLNKAGADIKGAGTSTVIINGAESLKGVEHTVMPDRIEAVTFIAAAAATHGNIVLKNIDCKSIKSTLNVFEAMGCKAELKGRDLKFSSPEKLKAVPYIKSFTYPDFPTDAGPVTVASLLKAEGTSIFIEGIFQNRFRYIEELGRMGADIKTEGNTAFIRGVPSLNGAGCVCTDLRGGAALAVAALSAEGESVLYHSEYINRGYEKFEKKLTGLGAIIYTEDKDEQAGRI